MRPSLLCAAVVASTLLSTFGVEAGDPGVIGNDDRKPVDAREAPWRAVGHVNSAGHRRLSFCTGTLVAPRVVVTAAHCLVYPWDNSPIPAHDIHFVAGVQREEKAGHSVARCVRFAPGALRVTAKYNPDLPVHRVPLQALIDDLAVIVLEDDIAIDPVPPATGLTFRSGLDVAHAAYPADRRYRQMADQSCALVGQTSGLWLTSCDTFAASSGGPVFVTRNGVREVAAVMVASAAGDGVTIAVPLAAWPELPLDADCPGGGSAD